MFDFSLYIITLPIINSVKTYPQIIREIIKGGATIIQWRQGNLTDKEFLEIGFKIREITSKYKIPLIVNNRPDIALLLEADGIHLGQDDLPVKFVKNFLKKINQDKLIIGVSTHNIKQAIDAGNEGADYIAIGPVYPTSTKPSYLPVGLKLVKEVKKIQRIPVVAIGGINATNIKEVRKTGVDGVAVGSYIFNDVDPYQKTKIMISKWREK